MPDPIYTSHQGLINLANQECGYRNVYVGQGDSGRWSNKGNLVIEHNNRGTEETCSGGRVISGEQQNRGYGRPTYQEDRYQPRYQDRGRIDPVAAGAVIFLGGALLGAALSDH